MYKRQIRGRKSGQAGPPTTALLSIGLATSVSKSWSCLSLQTPLLGPVLGLLEALGFVNGLGLEELASIDDKPAVPTQVITLSLLARFCYHFCTNNTQFVTEYKRAANDVVS